MELEDISPLEPQQTLAYIGFLLKTASAATKKCSFST
jgi:hypothetical protein